MKIIVLSRAQVPTHVFNATSALIAITTPPSGIPAEIHSASKPKRTLWLQFADVHDSKQLYAMQSEHADQLWEFIRENFVRQSNGPFTTLVVYCDAGASRSPSLAMAVIDIMGWARSDLICMATSVSSEPPNRHVYETIRQQRIGRDPRA